jgi:hypothetical protein
MQHRERFSETGDLHPIDLVETVATTQDWSFDRVGDDQIAMAVEGQWRTYSLTLAWSEHDEVLRLVCCFEMEPPEGCEDRLNELLNRINGDCWTGAFVWWADQKMMAWRAGLPLSGGACAQSEQVNAMVAEAVLTAERFYPAMQLVCWGGRDAASAMEMAIGEAYGTA